MAKRGNTSGGPRKRQLTAEDLERRHQTLSKAEREHQRERLILQITAAVAGTTLVVVLVALIYDLVFVPNLSLSTVGDDKIEVSEFQDRVQYERYALAEQVRAFYDNAIEAGLDEEQAQNQTFNIFAGEQGGSINYLVDDDLLGQEVLRQMEQELVIAQAAEEFGVSAQVDEAAVQTEIDRLASLLTNESLEATPSATPSEEPTITLTPLVSATPSYTPSASPVPSATPIPTLEGCAEGEDCPSVTPPPTSEPTVTPSETPNVTETPTSTPITEAESRATVVAFREAFLEQGRDKSGFSEEAIRQVFYYQALREAMVKHVTTQTEGDLVDYYISPDDIWVDTRHILVQFPEGEVVPEGDDNSYFAEAQALYEALQAGEPFAALAQANSDDLGSGARGGALGWSSSGGYVAGFKEAVETLPLGEISTPVRSQFGYHLIQVMDREIRPYDEARLEQLQNQEFDTWVSNRQLSVEIERREDWQELIPSNPDYNSLLSDILPRFERGGFVNDEDE